MKKLLLPFFAVLLSFPVLAAVPSEISDDMLSLLEMSIEIGGSALVAVICIDAILTFRRAA